MMLNSKLAMGGLSVVLATAYLAYLGASSSWQYYVHVDECTNQRTELTGQRLRVNGRVKPKTLQLRGDRMLATFMLAGDHSELSVTCTGPLPDNLAEGIDVVVEGKLETNGTLHGDKVLTKCASKYAAKQPIPRN